MVASYVETISSGNNGVFFRLLLKWAGSLYKLVWVDLIIYLLIYYFLSILYRFGLNDASKRHFEYVVQFCDEIRNNIPIPFILGFFVTGVIGRWWQLYQNIPYIEEIAFYVQSFVEGHGNPQFVETEVDEKKKMIVKDPEIYESKYSDRTRFHVMRYVMLSWTMLMLNISEQIQKRFKYNNKANKKNGRALLKNVSMTAQLPTHHHACTEFNIKTKNNTNQNNQTGDDDVVDDDTNEIKQRDLADSDIEGYDREEMYTIDPTKFQITIDEFADLTAHEEEEREIEKFCHHLNNDEVVKSTFGKLITEDEEETLKAIVAKHRYLYGKSCGLEYWIPLQWACRVVQKAGIQGYFADPRLIGFTLNRLDRLRIDMQSFEKRAEIIIPLLYTQVVIIVVYTYFLALLFASQFVEKRAGSKNDIKDASFDMFVPFFEILVFLFFNGWLKVAICVMNPFGSDDEDFDISDQLTFNIHRCYHAAISNCFPIGLDRACMAYFQLPSAKDDNLQQFLDYNTNFWNISQYAAKQHYSQQSTTNNNEDNNLTKTSLKV